MKSIYQSFNRGGIPVSYPVNVISEDEYTEQPAEHLNTPRVLCLSLLAAANAAVLAQCLLLLINGLMNLSFLGRFSFEEADPTDTGLGIFVIGVPVLGALVAILMIRYCIRGVRKGKQCHLIEPFASGVYIGTGVPLGIEGAVICSSFIFSNFTKNKWKTTYAERRILAAAGIVSGIAYLFGSPLAALALALELMLVEFTVGSIFPLILAGAVGASFHFLYRGVEPVFTIPEVPMPSTASLLGYMGTGAIVGLVAVFVTKTVRGVSWVFGKLPMPLLWRPLIGAVLIGVMGYFAPDMLGMGYGHISNLLMGKVTLQLLFIVGIVKFVAWTVALGSGTPGGTVLPLMIMGGAFGLFITLLLQYIMPSVPLNFSVAALIGMAAMLAGGLRILPTAILFAFETTHERHALLPLVCACTAAYLVSFLLAKKRKHVENGIS